jgi:hypothetical protein
VYYAIILAKALVFLFFNGGILWKTVVKILGALHSPMSVLCIFVVIAHPRVQTDMSIADVMCVKTITK